MRFADDGRPQCKKVEITDELASQILTPHNMEPWVRYQLTPD
jgi:hypothetical protein